MSTRKPHPTPATPTDQPPASQPSAPDPAGASHAAEATTPPEPAPDARERERLALDALAAVRARLADTDRQRQALNAEALTLGEARGQLTQTIERLGEHIAALRDTRVPAAEAVRQSVAGTAAEAGADEQVRSLRQQIGEAEQRLGQRQAELDAYTTATQAERERIALALDDLAHQRSELLALTEALQAQANAAHASAGEALMEDLVQRQHALEERVAAATAARADAQDALAHLRAEAAQALAPFPERHQAARTAGLLTPPALPGAELAAAYDAFLATLEGQVATGDALLGRERLSSVLGQLGYLQLQNLLSEGAADGKRQLVEALRRHVRDSLTTQRALAG